MLKDKVKDPCEWLDEEYKRKWKNLFFTKDSNSYFGLLVYDSEEAALKRVKMLLNNFHDKERGCWVVINGPHIIDGIPSIFHKDLSHIIQIPYKE